MNRNFKNLLPVDLSFVKSGDVVCLDVDESGAPLNKEARKRLNDGGLIEIKKETRNSIEQKDLENNRKGAA